MGMGNSKSINKRLWGRTVALVGFVVLLVWFFIPEGQRLKFSNLSAYNDDSALDFQELTEDIIDGEKSHILPPTPLKSSHCTKPYPGRQLIQYALMLDAGSTGSRIHVYRFNYCKASPELEDEVFAHVEPGLSAYSDDPEAAAESLDTLMEVAMEHVPVQLQNCTPVAVKATAGLRLLGKQKSEDILLAVRFHLESNYPFPIIEKEGVVIMDGRDEGVYAWITVNYLLERIGSAKRQPTAAIFDLGGGSTQIVFEPDTIDGFEIAPGDHRYELEYGGHKYVLYQHSYLGYGLMEARKAIKNLMANMWNKGSKVFGVDASELGIGDDQIPHPCLPRNYTEVWPVKDNKLVSLEQGTSVLFGTGAGHAQCRAITERVLNKEKECPLTPCAFDGVYQPPLVKTLGLNDIFAFSYFYDRASPLGMPSEFSLKELRDLTDEVCAGDLIKFAHLPEAIKELHKNPHYCMDLTFIYGLLHIGYEIPLEREVKIAKKIKGIETGWCLGAAIAVLDQKLWCKG